MYIFKYIYLWFVDLHINFYCCREILRNLFCKKRSLRMKSPHSTSPVYVGNQLYGMTLELWRKVYCSVFGVKLTILGWGLPFYFGVVLNFFEVYLCAIIYNKINITETAFPFFLLNIWETFSNVNIVFN